MGEKLKKEEIVQRLEEGLIPDEELRGLVREQLQKRLQWGYKATHEEQLSHLLGFSKLISKKVISEEMKSRDSTNLYELPVSFYQIVHGVHLKQSVGYFENESTTLDEAETVMIELYCKRAQIRDGQKILDLGCGFGALTFYIAKNYQHCQVTAVTNNKIQRDFIQEQSRLHKLSNVEVLSEDIVTLETNSTFDRVFAVGIIEHMQNCELLFRKISHWLTKDGLLFIDHVCHKTFAYELNEPVDENDWSTKFTFPMLISSASFLLYFQEDLLVENHWTISGNHFSRTTTQWLKRIDENYDDLHIIAKSITSNKDEATKILNYWRFINIFTSEMLGYSNGEEWMNSLVLFKKR